MIQWPEKIPFEVDDRWIDWTERLQGASIISSTWEHTPGVVVEAADRLTSGRTGIRVSGGEDGRRYYFSNAVVLSDGRVLAEVAVQLVLQYRPTEMVAIPSTEAAHA